jgi:N6-L-threonylcarbamoyladenine synthase
MNILAIETSCDETAVCLGEAEGGLSRGARRSARFTLLGNALLSQIALHAPYGGVFPSLAKREHQKNLVPLLAQTLQDASLLSKAKIKTSAVAEASASAEASMDRSADKQKSNVQVKSQKFDNKIQRLHKILEREPELLKSLLEALHVITTSGKPPIDAIAVTYGPGLEPALWVGINFARALSLLWDVPVVPINHMEGHVVSALLRRVEVGTAPATSYQLPAPRFPALALLVSGGHTELVLMKDWLDYRVIGETRDDAAGEAFDKVARMLNLPYPGGPEISRLAEMARRRKSEIKNQKSEIGLPRPMLHSPDFDFSFSGLKTAVLYLLKASVQHRVLNKNVQHSVLNGIKAKIALEFENAVVEVLVAKTLRAAERFGARSVLLGGGVAANLELRRSLASALERESPDTALFLPDPALTGDNAVMIAAAAYLRLRKLGIGAYRVNPPIRAQGNLRLG